MSSTTFEDIFAFTREALWDVPGGMNENTALAHDLQVAGLDGKLLHEIAVDIFEDGGRAEAAQHQSGQARRLDHPFTLALALVFSAAVFPGSADLAAASACGPSAAGNRSETRRGVSGKVTSPPASRMPISRGRGVSAP